MARKKREEPSTEPKQSGSDLVPCNRPEGIEQQIINYADELKENAHVMGNHGMSKGEFRRSGLFRAAVERLRGQQVTDMTEKKQFIAWALEKLKLSDKIISYDFEGSNDRHDYKVVLPGNWQSLIEAKGCLDGNNVNIFERPNNADEFLIWSLCQNPGSDPKNSVRSGITRLGAELITEGQKKHVDALIVWDMLCGLSRTCPKILEERCIEVDGRRLPPPCIYLFPRGIPDPKYNPDPPVWELKDVRLAEALLTEFGGDMRDVTEVHIKVQMNGQIKERQTTLIRDQETVFQSGWIELKRT